MCFAASHHILQICDAAVDVRTPHHTFPFGRFSAAVSARPH